VTAPETRWALGRRPALDGIRGLAILLVMAQHFGIPLFASGGVAGVTTFFVLSGFLITTVLLEERERSGRVDLRAFYVRRAIRLLPALIVMLAFFVLIEWGWDRIDYAAPRAAAALLYVGNWANLAINLGPLFHTWSLGVEEQFYAVWPLLIVVVLTFSRRRALTVVAVSLVAICVGLRAAGFALGELERSVDSLMIGSLLALVATSGLLPRSNWLAYPGIIVLAIASVVPWTPTDPDGWAIGLLAIGLGAATVVASACAQPSFVRKCLEARALVSLGRISYGLYLWHFVVLWLVGEPLMNAGWNWPVRLPVLLVVSLAAAAISWRYVEQPTMRLRHRLVRTHAAREPIAAVA
jgi:peptidoglycan/LPS O-acetylase OafA/YrhL